MAGRFFNFFRRGRSRSYLATQTLVACQKRFTHGFEEINTAHQNLRYVYDSITSSVQANDVKLQATEDFIEKLYDEFSPLNSIATKLKQQIETDEKYVAERKKAVTEIRSEIQHFRSCLENLKTEHGFNEWIERNKDSTSQAEKLKADRVKVENETFRILERIAQMSEAHDETDDEIEKLQDMRENYIDCHNEDLDDFKAKQELLLQRRKLFSMQPMEKTREMVFLFSSKITELDNIQEELIKVRAMRTLREHEIGIGREEENILAERNEELLFRVLQDKGDLKKLKGETEKAQPLEYQLPSGDTVKRWIFS